MTQPNFLEVLSPSFVGSKLVKLSLSEFTPKPSALQDVRIDIDWDQAEQYGGVVLPVMIMVQAPNPSDFIRQIYRRTVPDSFVFTPKERGTYLVVAREVFHNQLHGSLELQVEGELTSGA